MLIPDIVLIREGHDCTLTQRNRFFKVLGRTEGSVIDHKRVENAARRANSLMISTESSDEPSSQTTSSSGVLSWATMLASCSRRNRSPLKVHIATEKLRSNVSSCRQSGRGLECHAQPALNLQRRLHSIRKTKYHSPLDCLAVTNHSDGRRCEMTSNCSRPKISVCMAAYQGESYIILQLRSILGQLSNDNEVIIVDDGSTDRTCGEISALQDPRIVLIQEIPRTKECSVHSRRQLSRSSWGDRVSERSR